MADKIVLPDTSILKSILSELITLLWWTKAQHAGT